MMNTCAILGISWSYIAVIMEQVYETYGIKDFRIYKNLEVAGEPLIGYNPLGFTYSIHEPGSYQSIEAERIVFGVSWPKAKVFVLRDMGLEVSDLSSCIHPSAYIAPTVQYEEGLLIEPKVIVSSQTLIGQGVTIKRGTSIGHHNRIGNFTDISPGVTTASGVTIGRGTIISTGVVVRNGVTIGENVYLGMGSVVTKDIPDGVVAYGNPCKVVRDNLQWKI
jgi:sugar O-acyltransferase (sialic acid O-acetyltransferase NeuD family)